MSLLKHGESPEISDLPITGNKINICYASSQKYSKFLALSILTVLKSKNPDDDISIYILDGGLGDNDKRKILDLKNAANCNIKFINVDSQIFRDLPVNKSDHLAIQTYYRLLIPDLIPEVDKVLYLDCDVEVRTSLDELYNTDLSDSVIAAVRDVGFEINHKRLDTDKYFNSGVMLLDLAALRKTNFTGSVFTFIENNREKLKYYDQDVINMYFAGQIKELDAKWNCQKNIVNFKEFKKDTKDANIVHYLSNKKYDFVYQCLPLVFKTGYAKELFPLYLKRIYIFIIQWLFRVRNYDETKKQITILGMDFYVKRKR